MQIGEVGEATGLSADTLRYYEKIGLMPRVARDASGRRAYERADLSRLRFIRRAQALDFSLAEIAQLLELRAAPRQARQDVRELARDKLNAIETKFADLEHLKSELTLLLERCDAEAERCAILDHMQSD